MIQTATFAGQLLVKTELWDKVRACARLSPDGRWEVNVESSHCDDQLSNNLNAKLAPAYAHDVADAPSAG